jgi:hypothetical protein
VVVKKVKKWLLPVLGKQLCKLRLPHFLFDARDWYGPGYMAAALLLVLLQGSVTVIFGEGLATVKFFQCRLESQTLAYLY